MDLSPIIEHLPGFAVVLARLTGLFLLAPVLGSRAVYRQVKVGLAVVLAFAVYPVLLGMGDAGPLAGWVGAELSLWWIGPVLATELLIGYAMGWVVAMPGLALQIGGSLMEYKIGLGFAQTLNPELNEQAGPISQLFFLLGLALFMAVDGHVQFVAVMLHSFEALPPGRWVDPGETLAMALRVTQLAMVIAVQLSAPLLTLLFLQTVAIGFLAKTMPQLNIISVGLTLRILVGTTLLLVLVRLAGSLYHVGLDGAFAGIMDWLSVAGR